MSMEKLEDELKRNYSAKSRIRLQKASGIYWNMRDGEEGISQI